MRLRRPERRFFRRQGQWYIAMRNLLCQRFDFGPHDGGGAGQRGGPRSGAGRERFTNDARLGRRKQKMRRAATDALDPMSRRAASGGRFLARRSSLFPEMAE